jgi:feruloyl esterase
MRSFFFPDNGHCGGGPAGTPLINSGNLFKALENWVENDVAPDYVVARSSDNARSRKICMYPHEARYKGRGDTDRAASFLCKANDEEPTAFARDSVTAKLYREAP